MKSFLVKALKNAIRSLVFLAALVLFVVLIAVGTEAGSRRLLEFALQVAADQSGYRISMADMDGTLISRVDISGLEVRSPETAAETAGSLSVSIDALAFDPNLFALFDSLLQVRALRAEGIRLVQVSPAQAPASGPVDIDAALNGLFTLPLAVDLQRAEFVDISAVLDDANWPVARVTLALALDAQLLALDTTIDTGNNAGLTASAGLTAGSLTTTGGIAWRAMAGDIPARGSLVFEGDPNDLTITHTLAAPAGIRSTGMIHTGLLDRSLPSIDLAHAIGSLAGSGVTIPGLSDLSGNISTRGDQGRLGIQGDLSAAVNGFESVNAGLDLVYDGGQVLIQALSLRSDRLALSLDGQVEPGEDLSASLDWTLDNFSDGDLVEQVALESLSGSGTLALEREGGRLLSSLGIASLTGRLNGYSLSGAGSVSILDRQVQSADIELMAGNNSLVATGDFIPQLDFTWRLAAPELNRLLPELAGSVTGQGTFGGSWQLPRINGALNAGNISLERGNISLALDSVVVEAAYDGTNNRILADAGPIHWSGGGRKLDIHGADLMAEGTLQAHEFRLESSAADLDLTLAARGGYTGGQWQGALSEVLIDSPYGDWRLRDALGLTLSRESALLGQHCWLMEELSLCGRGDWSRTEGASGNLQLDNFALGILNSRDTVDAAGLPALAAILEGRPAGVETLMAAYGIAMPAGSLVDGRLDAEMTFTGFGLDPAAATLHAIVAPRDLTLGVVQDPALGAEDEKRQVSLYGLDELHLVIERDNAIWRIDTGFEVFLPETGGLDFQGAFEGNLSLDAGENLDGAFDLAFADIAWLEALLPEVLNPNGNLEARGTIGGNLTRPLFVFDAALREGGFQMPEYGLDLKAIDLQFHSEQDNEITISGGAESGEGRISFDSRLTTPFLQSRTLDLRVTGEDFLLVNLPDTILTVNPDFRITYLDQVLNLSGDLLIPVFDLDIRNNQALVANGSVSVSRDTVVVSVPPGQERQIATVEDRLLGRIPVTADFMLGLGDRARFRGFGLDLNVTGMLNVAQTLDRPAVAHGELTIPTGTYSMYGQQLTIEDGRLLFLGNYLNPAVDIRAVRETSSAVVGMQMSGTINNLQAELFSTPLLPESEILALLVTGNSFQNMGNQDGDNMLGAIALLGLEKGQGLTGSVQNKLGLDTFDIDTGDDYRDSSLGLGKYLRPNLFMRYDIGLFDRENKLTLDYILTERLKLEVETGVSQSVDITYTVEK